MNSEIQSKIDDILEEMKRVYKNDSRPWVIGYSGGKDSTTVVQLVFTMLMQLPLEERHKAVYVVSSDTLIENPLVLGYLKHNSALINEGAKKANIPLYTHMVHPNYDNTYWTNIIGKGLPTPTSIRFRWCTEKLKIKPSNTFIEEKVKENGEVVILLGVRKAESIARSIRIKNREIDGYLLTPHGSLDSTYVYNPIVNLTTDDVWGFLLSNNGNNPWGASNNDLFTLYMGADGGECPFTTTNDKETPTCGNSRLGCWICTVVTKDKSLTGFIENGETWLQPLLDFRQWIVGIRNKHEYRMQYRRDGNHYYKKLYLDKLPLLDNYVINSDYLFANGDGEGYIDLKNCQSEIDKGNKYTSEEKDKIYLELLPLFNINNSNNVILDKSKVQKDDKGEFINVLGYGPFNFIARQEILKKLLELQKLINEEYEIDLISKEELEAIDKIWDDEEDLTHRTLVDLYHEVMGERLPWDDYKKPMFDKKTIDEISNLCDKHNIDQDLINRLLIDTNKYKHFTNRSVLDKSINKILNQRHLHKAIFEEIENDN
ncbi:DNA phosphorothioation system sulfurtransferase DndC [Clostridium aciditolerans]|uniref:DNA phosphorothioation system sulfurtransferase DndC n=1 Tax=Clostridium aciditolerans TaxID=339861 RepID=A0A934M543_9CLOT|nr:DNA phosphorothioation system sulfurtransferase DndC [Clostridium aciditolerans]MBI6874902.1 DNA phosphorothioation system sulfurtransferase DndC [Clostridium aciditolerans]